ncbi:PorV/PorQ family protein [Candidatus Margulisiibacteriota bacterium]
MLLIIMISLGTYSGYLYADQDSRAEDITRAGIGARPMGMGKAYTALADDANAVLMNPAGMAYFTQPKAMNINTQLLNDVYYTTLALAWPTKYGTFGVGYVNVGIQNIHLAEWQAGQPVIVAKGSYANNVMLLSYANRISDRLAWGLTLKNFSEQFANISAENASARGNNLDAGIIYRLSRNWSFGAVYQNLITTPTLIWGTGEKEILESHLKTGVAYQYHEPVKGFNLNRINYMFDMDIPVGDYYGLVTYHLGAEVWWADTLAVRAGLGTREAYVAGQMRAMLEPAMGLGLNLWGVQFDFTYAPGVLDLDDKAEKYFLSIAYQLPDEREMLPEEVLAKEKADLRQDLLVIKEILPERPYWGSAEITTMVVYEHVLTAKGVLGRRVDDFKKIVFESRSGQHLNRLRIYPGENWLAYEIDGQEYVAKFLLLKDYADIYSTTPGYADIQSLTMIGVFKGYRGNKGFFEPYTKVQPAELQQAISRLKNGYKEEPQVMAGNEDALTKAEAVRIVRENFGGSSDKYLAVFPIQVREDIAEGMTGGVLSRYEMAQLLAKTGKATEQLAQLSQDYGISIGDTYVSSISEE